MKKLIIIICLLLAAGVTINAQDQPAKSSAAERLATAIDEQSLDAALKIYSQRVSIIRREGKTAQNGRPLSFDLYLGIFCFSTDHMLNFKLDISSSW